MTGGPAREDARGPRFRFSAASESGEIVAGVFAAGTRDAALGELRRRQLFVISLSEEETRASRSPLGRRRGPGGHVSLALWTRTLATMLAAGVHLSEALAFGAARAEGTPFGAAVAAVREAVHAGSTLAAALQAHPAQFDQLYVAMVAAGEEGGALPQVLARLAGHLEEKAELRSQLTASLLYPALLAGASGAGVTVLLLFVLPRFQAMIADVGGTLPLSTRLLLGASHLAIGWWWLWLAVAALAVVWVRRASRGVTWQERRLEWPVVGPLEQAWIAARLTRTLGILLQSGVPVLASLRIARASVMNSAIARRVARAEADVAEGARVSDALAEVLPPLAVRLLSAGEESGRLPELCQSVADTYDGEVRRTMRGLVALIEPALVIVFGVLVGWVALAMLQAIYSVNARAY